MVASGYRRTLPEKPVSSVIAPAVPGWVGASEKLIALMILVQGWENDDSSGSWSASGHTTPLAKRERHGRQAAQVVREQQVLF